MKARLIHYTGRVQGVGFRYSVKQIASEFDISGYVMNMGDGRVELWIQGDDEELDGMEKEILKSHLKGFIKEISSLDQGIDRTIKGFEIRR